MPVLFILLPIVLGILAVLIVIFFVRPRPGKARRVSGPECGSCGYSAQGATTLICPECGSDFRDVGLLTPNVRPGSSPAGVVMAWTFLVLIIGGILSAALAPVLAPTTRAFDETRRFSVRTDPRCSLTFVLAARETIWPWQRGAFRPRYPRNTSVTVELVGPTGRGTMLLYPRGERVEIVMSDNSTRTLAPPVTEKIVDDWLTDVGFDLTDPGTDALADEAFALIDEFASRTHRRPQTAVSAGRGGWGSSRTTTTGGSRRLTHFSEGSSSMSARGGPHPFYAAIAVGFWIGIWLVGLRLIIRGAPTHRVAGS